jgi:hypothetical protein
MLSQALFHSTAIRRGLRDRAMDGWVEMGPLEGPGRLSVLSREGFERSGYRVRVSSFGGLGFSGN